MKQQKEALLKEKETSEKVAARAFAQVRIDYHLPTLPLKQ